MGRYNNDSFEKLTHEIEQTENTSGLESGDTCPECDRELHSLSHDRTPQLGTERHEDAPETEIVCRAHGVQEAF